MPRPIDIPKTDRPIEVLSVLYRFRNNPSQLRAILKAVHQNPALIKAFTPYHFALLFVLACPYRNTEEVLVQDEFFEPEDLQFEYESSQPTSFCSREKLDEKIATMGRALRADQWFAQELRASLRRSYPEYALLFSTQWWAGFHYEIEDIKKRHARKDPFSIVNEYLGGYFFSSQVFCPFDGSPIPKDCQEILTSICRFAVQHSNSKSPDALQRLSSLIINGVSVGEKFAEPQEFLCILDSWYGTFTQSGFIPKELDRIAEAHFLVLLLRSLLWKIAAGIVEGSEDEVLNLEPELFECASAVVKQLQKFRKSSFIREAEHRGTTSFHEAVGQPAMVLYPNLELLNDPLANIFSNADGSILDAPDQKTEGESDTQSSFHENIAVAYATISLQTQKQFVECYTNWMLASPANDISADRYTVPNLSREDAYSEGLSASWFLGLLVNVFGSHMELDLEPPSPKRDADVFAVLTHLTELGLASIRNAMFASWLEIRKRSRVPVKDLPSFLGMMSDVRGGDRRMIEAALSSYLQHWPGAARFVEALFPIDHSDLPAGLSAEEFVIQSIGKEMWARIPSDQKKALVKAEGLYRRLEHDAEVAREVFVYWAPAVESLVNQIMEPVRSEVAQIEQYKTNQRAKSFVDGKWSLNELLMLLAFKKRSGFFTDGRFDKAWIVLEQLPLRSYLRESPEARDIWLRFGAARNLASHDSKRPPSKWMAAYFRGYLLSEGFLREFIRHT